MPAVNWPATPGWAPASSGFRLRSFSLLSGSPYTGAHKAVSIGQVWVCQITLQQRSVEQNHIMGAFLNALEGPSGVVRIFDWLRKSPRLLSVDNYPFDDGTWFDDGFGWTDSGYAPLLTADAARGDKQVSMEGLPVSAPAFRRGDLIELGGYLYELTRDASGDADGEATIFIQPGLRAGLADGDPVRIYYPSCPMRMTPDTEAMLDRDLFVGAPATLTFVEDVP